MDSGEPLKLDGVARLLLNEKLYLSALELHTELLHRGSELPVLRDFFNNPGNFEHLVQITEPVATTPCPLPRTSSVQTLESLDMTRYSEDGEGLMAEKVAVLEFELRKAKDAIRSLRNNLTVVSEHTPDAAVVISASASLAPLQGDDGCRTVVDDLPHSIGGTTACTPGEAPLLPHEQRAVNFLVNEYLLEHNYKLTAITFAEEDDNQGRDFDDWDEVGLNISKPPRLGQLYRKFNRWHSSTRKTSSTELAPPCSMEQKPESCPSIDLPDIVGHAS
ncbi:lisH domain and HEAT repeat-containing protein KIAA1468 homolog isoform X3 [Varroa destructor]|nr:lisH domain and HEAT repeat-containing protein KIAA1468 homolog isoform X3 [Varroa destructor]XP_022647050.1 lisH domain and HEAT repeat-containing protein KIAA1468 homolog isoform X3 [Varroa destructor]XP_022647051.1 lisH domain and HEAT repeat-containing protein KIAA1468 homolog isoform X3 [Varroa destructor]XP_022647052.1 lisH domain and HEAT repeat-containing protein KIAA1468 homolog isoform X3 [Varroa destructor]XP_022647053.1 lisH domain and HEAT repeat-containing protein KIAA1468 homo